MNKHIFLLLLLSLSLGACRSLRVRDFHTQQSLPTRLPPLGLLVHERSFLEAFDAALDRDIAIDFSLGGPYPVGPWVGYEVTDQALQDVFHVLENELSDNLNETATQRFGHARFKLLYYKRRNSGWGWTVASAVTLLIPNVFGMPARTHRVELELEMEIVDAEGRVIAKHIAPGIGKAYVAAYHGYDRPTATRKANMLALQNALSKIKGRLAAEAPALKTQLEGTGTLHKLDGK